jgi:hypothetical protein
MTRTEIDLTDSKRFDVDITKSGNVVSVVMATDSGKVEMVMDMCDFVELIAHGSLMTNKKAAS